MSAASAKNKKRIPVWLWVVFAIVVWALVFIWMADKKPEAVDAVQPEVVLSEVIETDAAPIVAEPTVEDAAETPVPASEELQLPPAPDEVMLQILYLFDW